MEHAKEHGRAVCEAETKDMSITFEITRFRLHMLRNWPPSTPASDLTPSGCRTCSLTFTARCTRDNKSIRNENLVPHPTLNISGGVSETFLIWENEHAMYHLPSHISDSKSICTVAKRYKKLERVSSVCMAKYCYTTSRKILRLSGTRSPDPALDMKNCDELLQSTNE
ncbi:hypothetical protein CBL_00519 [Carabus blaptoides fortunei]